MTICICTSLCSLRLIIVHNLNNIPSTVCGITLHLIGDSMEKMIKSLEKEQGVHVERLDIMRDRAARKLYEKLVEGNLRSPFPLLYHRESLQRVYGLAEKDLVRSWSKGRLLPDTNKDEKEVTVLGGEEGVPPEEEMDMEDLELEMDQELTPMQRRGKEAMKRRMEEGRKKS